MYFQSLPFLGCLGLAVILIAETAWTSVMQLDPDDGGLGPSVAA